MDITEHTVKKRAAVGTSVGPKAVHGAMVGLTLFLLIGLTGLLFLSAKDVGALQWHFNPFVLLSLASFVSSTVTFIFILRIKQRTDSLLWFAGFVFSVSTWAFGETISRLTATPAAATFWSPLTTIGAMLLPIMLYMFALSYAKPKYALQPYLFACMLIVSASFIFLDAHTEIFTHYHTIAKATWGYTPSAGPWFWVIDLWAPAGAAAAFFQFYFFRKSTSDPILRKQAKLFMIAIIIPLVGGTATDGILPALHIDAIPPLTNMLLTVTSVIICYGIMRYRFFNFSPSLIATQILSTMNEAVIAVLPDLRISYVNAWTEEMLGHTAADLTDKPFTLFLEQQMSVDEFEAEVKVHMKGHHFAVLDTVRLNVPNKQLTVKLSVTKLNDPSQPYGYLIVMSDITALVDAKSLIEQQVTERTRQLHEEQAKLRASIEGLPVGFVLLDEHNRILIQNPVLEHIFGQTALFTSLDELQTQLVDTNMVEQVEVARTQGKVFDLPEVGMGAKVLHVFGAPVKIVDGATEKVIGTVLLMQDITEEKILARSRDEFFSIASHELRTPLTAIKGNASMMIDYYKELLDQDDSFREMVFDIHTSSARLIEIVNDFLDVSRIEQGKMSYNFEVVALDKIIEFVMYEMRAILREKNIGLTTDTNSLGELPQIWADKDRTTQIVYNLVGNAVKFTEQGGVTIATAVEGDNVVIRVTDTGRGISLDNQKLLFHKFQQAGDSLLTRDTTRGTGLGLYISKLLATSMHGDLELERSEEGKGSTFKLTLPLATGHETPSSTEEKHTTTDTATGLTTSV